MCACLLSPDACEFQLDPGQFHFGEAHTRIRTLLGSCVAVTLWHPRLRHGGMCHYLLPDRAGPQVRQSDGRYADGAIALFMRALAARGTRPQEYEVKLFGGGRMFVPGRPQRASPPADVGQLNIEAGRRLLRQHGFRVSAEHLAGDGHRHLVFNLASGDVWVRHVAELAAWSGRHAESWQAPCGGSAREGDQGPGAAIGRPHGRLTGTGKELRHG